jgi:hypothetical protein
MAATVTAVTAALPVLLKISFLTAKSFLKPVIAHLKDSLILHEGTSQVLLKVGQAKHQVGTRVTCAFDHFALKKPLPADPRITLSDAERNGVFSLLSVNVEPLDEDKARKEGADCLADLAVYRAPPLTTTPLLPIKKLLLHRYGTSLLSLLGLGLWSLHQDKVSSAAMDARIRGAVESARAAMRQQMDEQARAIRELEDRVRAQGGMIEKHEKDMEKVKKWTKF